MRIIFSPYMVAASLALSGCATVQYGSKEAETSLRNLAPTVGKTSLYVCREAAAFVGAGNRTTVMVNNRSIGTLKPNNFAYTLVEPGAHEVFIKYNPGGNSGVLNITSQPGEVVILWVGMTGGGFGVLTIDNFSSKREAENCVKGAEYAVPAE
jgi:hypothetical protein